MWVQRELGDQSALVVDLTPLKTAPHLGSKIRVGKSPRLDAKRGSQTNTECWEKWRRNPQRLRSLGNCTAVYHTVFKVVQSGSSHRDPWPTPTTGQDSDFASGMVEIQSRSWELLCRISVSLLA